MKFSQPFKVRKIHWNFEFSWLSRASAARDRVTSASVTRASVTRASVTQKMLHRKAWVFDNWTSGKMQLLTGQHVTVLSSIRSLKIFVWRLHLNGLIPPQIHHNSSLSESLSKCTSIFFATWHGECASF